MTNNSSLLINIGQGLSILTGLLTIDSWNIASRPKEAKTGTFGFNSQTHTLEYWDGTNWFAASMKEK